MRTEFEKLYLGDFELSCEERVAAELAEEYHSECEAYDRLVCSGMRDGIAIPLDGREHHFVNVNSAKVRKAKKEKALSRGIPTSMLMTAISRHRI